MPGESNASLETELQQTIGALEILETLREEFAQWLEEAEDDSKHEALENVLGHIEAMEEEYKGRRNELDKQLKAS